MDDYEVVGNGGDGNQLYASDDEDSAAEAAMDMEREYGNDPVIRESQKGGA